MILYPHVFQPPTPIKDPNVEQEKAGFPDQSENQPKVDISNAVANHIGISGVRFIADRSTARWRR